MKFLTILGTLVAVSFAVPTPDRIKQLFPERTVLLDRISSFGRLLAQDAHRVYRKSFDGFEVNDLDAMLDQLLDGQERISELLGSFPDDQESEDTDEDDGPEDVFTELISRLDMDRDSMSVLLSGADRLEVDGKRMEYMMELLDKLSKKVTDLLHSLDKEREFFMWTWIKRHLKSSLEGMLRVIDSIKSAIEDAEGEVAIDEELEIPDDVLDEERSEELEIQHGAVNFGEEGGALDNTDEFDVDDITDDPTLDLEWERYQDGEGGRSKRSVGQRQRRFTVTSASRFRNRNPYSIRRGQHVPIKTDIGDYSSAPLGGGWSVGAAGLMWKNPKHRGHRETF